MTFQQALIRRGVRYRVSDSFKVHLNCPFCVGRGKPADTKMRLCVHARQRWGKCVHCEWKSRNAVFPVLRQLGIDAQVEGFDREEQEPVALPKLPADFVLLDHADDDLDRQARAYLLHRGVTQEQIRECKIGVTYIGKYAYRIIFPVYVGKELKCFNARSFTDGGKGPKYLLTPGDKYLFHFDPEAEVTVLSEGVFKALRIAQVTKWGSAAILGHDLTDKQLDQIKASKCKRIVLYPDTDAVGRRGFVHVADKLLEHWKGAVEFAWPVALPADDAPLEDLRRLLASPTPYTCELRWKILGSR